MAWVPGVEKLALVYSLLCFQWTGYRSEYSLAMSCVEPLLLQILTSGVLTLHLSF